jgi:uncharacterized protein YgbK (DUF1537 family)
LLKRIQDKIKASARKVVVLDDDPTGTQTVHNVLVVTEWSEETLAYAFARKEAVFYILTNSRSYPAEEAVEMNREIARNLAQVAKRLGRDFDVVSRSDSTLRGHYPHEVEALKATLENCLGEAFSGEIIAPFFFEGGRLTAYDIHWVEEGEWLIPAAETEYARDSVFGYRHSHLRKWLEEKTNGRVKADAVVSITLDDVRTKGPSAVADILRGVAAGESIIVNAVTYRDMEVFVLGLLEAEEAGKRFIFRTAASFVKVRGGIESRGLLTVPELYPSWPGRQVAPSDAGLPEGSPKGGFIIVGSYVQKTTEQLKVAQKLDNLASIELDARALLNSQTHGKEIGSVTVKAEKALEQGRDVIIFTSRCLVTGKSEKENMEIARQVSDALVEVTRKIKTRPKFVVAKGGITSSDIGTKALDVTKAIVLGQILAGVPVWLLGEESRFPGIPFVVFPGNVGDRDALAQVISILRNNRNVEYGGK